MLRWLCLCGALMLGLLVAAPAPAQATNHEGVLKTYMVELARIGPGSAAQNRQFYR